MISFSSKGWTGPQTSHNPPSLPFSHHIYTQMIILSWNLHGMGARIKRSSLRKMINSKNPNFIFLQETKMEQIDKKITRTCWRSGEYEWRFSPSVGKSGGLLLAWDSKFFSMKSLRCERYWIALCGEIPSKKFKCILINIYNPCDMDLRNEVFKEIECFWNEQKTPCLLMGVFNEVTSNSDRGSQLASNPGMNAFKDFIHNIQLLDIPPSNGRFSWFRGNSKSRLDRLLINPEWLAIFPNLKSTLLNRTISDHCPLLASSSEKNWGPKPFRLINCWLSHPSCLKVINESWSSSFNLSLPEKFKMVKSALKKWNSSEFGFIETKILSLESFILSFDDLANHRALDEPELQERRHAQIELWDWLKRKESLWAQKSRAQWLKEGDKNSRYFHSLASIRKRKNAIESITMNGTVIDSPSEIKKAAAEFFKSIFTEKHQKRPTFQNLDFKRINHTQAAALTSPFTKSEINDAVSSCASDKAPGPDGFNFRFIKSVWDIIKRDVYDIIQNFWSSSQLPQGSNIAFITLIPKKDYPDGFHEYRPISMVGSLYKIISKLLAKRLQSVISDVISPSQSSFIKGLQILDGALIASEIIDSCKRRKSPIAIFKIDFHKAFDSVSWSFLEWSLSQMGFPNQWLVWIKSCINSASASILINGSPSPPIKLQKGLRQGDPLSLFLFNIAVEVLHLMIEKATSMQLWEYRSVRGRHEDISPSIC